MALCHIRPRIYRSLKDNGGSFFPRNHLMGKRLIPPIPHYKNSPGVSLYLVKLIFHFILFVIDEINVRWMTAGEPTGCFCCPVVELKDHTAKDGFCAILRLF